MVTKADQNGDGKLDKWELYEFCLVNYLDNEQIWFWFRVVLLVYIDIGKI